jgi:DNA polymerase-3 subunit epsilon
MNPIIFYDTETTGLPQWSLPSEDPSQPHITQLAAELFDEDSGTVLAYMDFLIKPEGWTIPADIEELTGITNERANLFGVPIAQVLPIFLDMWKKSTMRVAHNESFDMRMVRIELMRSLAHGEEYADYWKAGPAYCTQVKSTKLINLPPTAKMLAAGRKNAKSPNLGEAYRHFTGKELLGAHNAAVDLDGCKAVYFGIKAAMAAV